MNLAGFRFPEGRLDDTLPEGRVAFEFYEVSLHPGFSLVLAAVHKGIPYFVEFIGCRSDPVAIRQDDGLIPHRTPSPFVAGYQFLCVRPRLAVVGRDFEPRLPVI